MVKFANGSLDRGEPLGYPIEWLVLLLVVGLASGLVLGFGFAFGVRTRCGSNSPMVFGTDGSP